MMPSAIALPFLAAPALMALAALLVTRHAAAARRLASLLCLLVAVAALGAAAATWEHGVQAGQALLAVRMDAPGGLVLALTAFIGWVILRYSARYLDGNPGLGRYLRQLMLTLAGVWLLVVTNHLLVLLLAWAATDAVLHGLLTFFPDRPAAVLAARKRLITVSAANLLLLAAAGALHARFGTLALDGLARGLAAPGGTTGVALPALLVVAGVILKSAQLPVHGWLLQVMEAPTPVSALLHAGIVNIGGFVLLRLSGLLEAVPAAQGLLVMAGSLTAVLAALVMTTRVSVKVMLAWSTCAQMGFMLLEIGLGAYPLALLHLLAHSLYKAHAFLSAGGAVRRAPRPADAATTGMARGAGLAAGMAALAGVAWLAGLDPVRDPALAVLALAFLAGLLPLLRAALAGGRRPLLQLTGGAAGLVVLYSVWHRLFATLLPAAVPPAAPWLVLPGLGLLLLVMVQEAIAARPHGRLACYLHPRAFAGFHLDEGMTRLTLLLWPGAPAPALRESSTPSFPSATLTREHA
jgi:NAD(P)H-quinone oxidoreductase subunit 5